MRYIRSACGLLSLLLITGMGHAQVGLPSLPTVPQALGPALDRVDRDALSDVRPLADVRRLDIRTLLRTHRREVDSDADGAPVVRDEIIAIDPDAAVLPALQHAGFVVGDESMLGSLGLRVRTLRAPPGLGTRAALALARQVDPIGSYDFDHLFSHASAAMTPSAAAPAAPDSTKATATFRVGLIDSGVDGRHPALRGTTLQTWGCDGHAVPDAHGTAVASLLAGHAVAGHGDDATLYAADVYCGQPTGGAALTVARALAWLADAHIAVVNISLVGPPDRLLERAIAAAQTRGLLIVAAVGNDGPAAPPLYPAAYPGVLGVSAVNAHERVLPEAGRGPQVDFVAPGADMLAAAPGGRWSQVRGTSFAAPLVARLAARDMARAGRVAAAAVVAQMARDAVLPRGADVQAYGQGVLGATLPITHAPGN